MWSVEKKQMIGWAYIARLNPFLDATNIYKSNICLFILSVTSTYGPFWETYNPFKKK